MADQKPTKWMPALAKTITGFGRFYNGYTVRGMENIPREGGALIVLYHGLVPVDFWYFGLRIFLETGRQPHALVDRWLTKTPGLAWLTRAVGGVEANREVTERLLHEGRIVGVSPGGVREALFGEKYKLKWGHRKGFAELALKTGVPIIPGFTENVEGLYRAPLNDLPTVRGLYERTRLPLAPIFGLGPFPFPVKLTTWLGAPIEVGESDDVDSLVARTRIGIENLIRDHQDVDVSLKQMLLERFRGHKP